MIDIRLIREKPDWVKAEIATLRHMEKVRGAMRAGKKVVILWET